MWRDDDASSRELSEAHVQQRVNYDPDLAPQLPTGD